VLGTAMLADSALGAGVKCETWPAWQRFKLLYSSADGRVIDASTAAEVTTSTAQAYALFLALVANDRAAFAATLRWTNDHLCTGRIDQTLPAARWGRAAEGHSGILDGNSVTEADLWTAYSLGEAARLWNDNKYAHLATKIATNILQQHAAKVADLGTVLLPGSQVGADSCATAAGCRLSPGSMPLLAIRGLARQTKDPAWSEIAQSSERIIIGSAPKGFAPDWIELTRDGLVPDRLTQGIGSYDAIRVYLWAGMLPASDAARDKLATAFRPMLNNVKERATPAEIVDTQTLETHGDGPPGFSAALLPMLANARMTAALQTHRQRAAEAALQNNHNYYNDVLTLFGLGWLEQRYRFNRTGLLSVRWTPAGARPH
jgi:endoglucanase